MAMGMSQEAFDDRSGFARTYMPRIETGERIRPSLPSRCWPTP
ncbi:helix-turn-helix transcriptional regulator [Pseudomonas alkylphenolica]